MCIRDRYHILQRKFNVCGGNGGNWNESRGCVDDECTETSYANSEWEVINCALADINGSLYPEPETSEASADMQVVCGGHQYLCLSAPNSPPGEFALESPVSNSNVVKLGCETVPDPTTVVGTTISIPGD